MLLSLVTLDEIYSNRSSINERSGEGTTVTGSDWLISQRQMKVWSLLLFILALAKAEHSCSSELDLLVKNILPNGEAMKAASALRPGSLGNFDDCTLVPFARFVTAMLDAKEFSLVKTLMGLCVPFLCGPGQEPALLLYLQNLTHQGSLKVALFTFPEEVSIPTGSWVFIGFCGSLVCVVLVLSLYEWLKEAQSRWRNERAFGFSCVPSVSNELGFVPLPETVSFDGSADLERPERKPSSLFVAIKASYFLDRNFVSLYQDEDTFEFLNGIRVLSMIWVMVGHSQALYATISQNVAFYEARIHRSFFDQVTFSFTYSVDAFFVMGGFLVSLSVLRALKKRQFNVFKHYIHRVLRLTPVFLFWILFRWLVMPYLGRGPLWSSATLVQYCDNWWVEVLYIQPFWVLGGGTGAQCISQDWYLSTDLHLFIISPMFLLLCYKSKKIGFLIVGGCTLASLVYCIVVQYFTSPQSYQDHVYFPFWARFPSYAVGLCLGVLFDGSEGSMKVGCMIRFCFYAAAGVLMSVLVFVTYGTNDPHSDVNWYVFNGLDHFLWSLALGIVGLLFVLEYGGWVRTFLSWSVFRPLARLTYGAYLVHVGVLQYVTFSQQAFVWFSGMNWMQDVVLVVFLSYLLSLLSYLFVEKPLLNIEKLLVQS